jgi:hypothetical protein
MNVRRGRYDPPFYLKQPWERKYIPPDPKPLPSVPVDDVVFTKAVKTSVGLDNRLRRIQDKLNPGVEEARAKILNPNLPPPGKIEVLATDVDEKGQTWITSFVNRFGNIETKKIGQVLLTTKSALRRSGS